jgi:hypothetical protein
MHEGKISKKKLKVSKNRLIPRGKEDQDGNNMLGKMSCRA